MSKEEQQFDQKGARRSKRQRVPNQYYTVGIAQLKKMENVSRPNRKNKNQEDDSEPDQKNMSSNFKYLDSSNKNNDSGWLPCIMPDNRQIKVQILFQQFQQQPVQIIKQKIREEPAPKNNSKSSFSFLQNQIMNSANKKQQSTFDLLSLFKQAIHSVQDEPKPLISKMNSDLQKNMAKQLSKSKQISVIMPPKRVYEQDKDGKILSVSINQKEKVLFLNHSKLGIYQVPIQEFAQKITNSYTSQQEQTIKKWRQKLANSELLQYISILN